jgi:hypothetical protein
MADRFVFLRPDAERIAKAVRRVEGMREAAPLTFRRAPESPAKKVFRVCTFTGSWSIDTSKTVTFKNVTSTPNTVAAVNLFATINGSTVTSTTLNCAIAKDGTAWYLIASECP